MFRLGIVFCFSPFCLDSKQNIITGSSLKQHSVRYQNKVLGKKLENLQGDFGEGVNSSTIFMEIQQK